MIRSRLHKIVPLALLSVSGIASGGAFIAADGNNPNLIMHPTGYLGSPGEVTVNVCIDSASVNAAAIEIPVQNIVRTFNRMQPVSPNLKFGGDNNIPAGQSDFESVALHEVGHCIGLAHVNAASESGLGVSDRNYTKAAPGNNGTLNIDDGSDNIVGSRDDMRGDDINLHWFRRSDNNPFLSLTQPDINTMSVNINHLPVGDQFVANADRAVGSSLGFTNTEAVMQQGSFSDEDQRELTADDIDTLRLAQAGLDRVAGTGDDYTLTLTYGGLQPAGTPGCDLTIDFDANETTFAVCQTSFQRINGDDDNWQITSAQSFYNPSSNWFFNQTPNASNGPTEPDPFFFSNQLNVAQLTQVTSNTITISGNSQPAPISVTGGSYSIGCTGTFTMAAGTISAGQTVCLQHLAAGSPGGTVGTTLTIGGRESTFFSTTVPTRLQSGGMLTGLSGTAGSQTLIALVAVPDGATNLVISISDGTGDADLFVRFGAPPSPNAFDCRPFLGGNNETCSFASPQSGNHYVMIAGFTDFSGLKLEVQFTAPATPNDADSDGIRDGLDLEPATHSNVCFGDEVVFPGTAVLNNQVRQCAATIAIEVPSTTDVRSGGRAEMIAPEVRFTSGFSLPAGAELRVISEGGP